VEKGEVETKSTFETIEGRIERTLSEIYSEYK
jgi:hypothetical protein